MQTLQRSTMHPAAPKTKQIIATHRASANLSLPPSLPCNMAPPHSTYGPVEQLAFWDILQGGTIFVHVRCLCSMRHACGHTLTIINHLLNHTQMSQTVHNHQESEKYVHIIYKEFRLSKHTKKLWSSLAQTKACIVICFGWAVIQPTQKEKGPKGRPIPEAPNGG